MPEPTSHPSPDLRVTRTRRLLTQALIELSAEQSLEHITVRDLTERAQVGYATFFRHYSSIEDLLKAALEDQRTELLGLLPPLSSDRPEQAGTVVFQQVQVHAGLYRMMLQTDPHRGFLSTVVDLGVQSLLEHYEAKPDSRVPIEIAADHFIRSFLNLIQWWLNHDMPLSPEQMGEMYCDLILRPLEQTALQPRKTR